MKIEDSETILNNLIAKSKGGDTLIALPALLDGLLDACHSHTDGLGALRIQDALYEHIFCSGSELSGNVWSAPYTEVWPQPNNKPGLEFEFHHLSEDFVSACNFVLDHHSCPAGNDQCPKPAWIAFLKALQPVIEAQSIRADIDQQEIAGRCLEKIRGTLCKDDGLAGLCWQEEDSARHYRDDWHYVGAVFGALFDLTRNVLDHEDSDPLFTEKQCDALRAALKAAVDAGELPADDIDTTKIRRLFDSLAAHKVKQLCCGDCAGLRDHVFDSGMGIPEQLLLEQILRLARIKRLRNCS